MRRLVVPPGSIEGQCARLQGAVRHHLVDVLRLRPGAELLLVDGSGAAHRGRLQAVDATTAVVSIEEVIAEPSLPGPRLTLIYGLSRRSRTEWVLQKATELGVDEIALAGCRRSTAQGGGLAKLGRWEEIVRQAARQCGRSRLPVLAPLRPLPEVLQGTGAGALKLVSRAGAEPLSSLGPELAAAPEALALVVGPEGGLCDEELAMASAAGFRGVGLGPLVLRTETAAVVMLALCAFLTGRLDH